MKKILLIFTVILISTNVANAASGVDFKLGPSPYQSLQKARFDKESTERMQNAKRSAEEYAENHFNNLNSAEIEQLKRKPQININSSKLPETVE